MSGGKRSFCSRESCWVYVPLHLFAMPQAVDARFIHAEPWLYTEPVQPPDSPPPDAPRPLTASRCTVLYKYVKTTPKIGGTAADVDAYPEKLAGLSSDRIAGIASASAGREIASTLHVQCTLSTFQDSQAAIRSGLEQKYRKWVLVWAVDC